MLKIVKFSLLIFYIFVFYIGVVNAKYYKFYFAISENNLNYKNIVNSLCNSSEDINFICNIIDTANSVESLEMLKANNATFAIVRYDVAFRYLNYENNLIYSKIDDLMFYVKKEYNKIIENNTLNLQELFGDSVEKEYTINEKEVKLKVSVADDRYKLKIVMPLFHEYLFIFSKEVSNYFEIKELKWANVLVSDRSDDLYDTLKYLTKILGYNIENMYLDKKNNLELEFQALCDNKIDSIVVITSLNNYYVKKYLKKCHLKIGYINDSNLSIINIRSSYYFPVLIDPEVFNDDSFLDLKIDGEKSLVKDRFVKTISIANIVMASEDIEDSVVYEFLQYYYDSFLKTPYTNKEMPLMIELDEIKLDGKKYALLETSNNHKDFLRYFINKNIKHLHNGAIKFFKERGILR